MAKPTEISKGRSPAPSAAPAYNPQAASILQGQLRNIARYGKPTDIAKARDIAKGGGVPVWKRGMDIAAGVLGAPVRLVEATAAPAFVHSTQPDARSYWSKLVDPSYGAGYEINRMFPHANSWAKVGGGLAADIALDPLTYLSFGASPLLKAAGRGEGVARIFQDAADVAKSAEEAQHFGNLAAKAGKGVANLSREELSAAATLAGHDPGAFKVGVHFGFPHGGTPFTISDTGVPGALGRKLEQVGPAVSGAMRETKLGEALGGNLSKMRTWIHSEDPGLVRKGVRIVTGESRAKKIESFARRKMAEERAPLEAALRKAGVDAEELSAAMRERPLALKAKDAHAAEIKAVLDDATLSGDAKNVRLRELEAKAEREVAEGITTHARDPETGRRIYPADQGGPAWQAMAADPEKHELMSKWADMHANRVEWAHRVSGHGDVAPEWLADAEAGGRPHVPRVPSKEGAEKLGLRAKSSNDPAKKAFMEHGAIAPGTKEGEAFMKEHGVEIYTPGEKNAAFPDGAPSLEDQVEAVWKDKYGEDYTQLWEKDFFKSNEVYEHGLAKAIGKHKLANYLTAKGIARDISPTLAREGVTTEAGRKALADTIVATGRPQWREDLFMGWENGQMHAYTGKGVKNPAYEALNMHIAQYDKELTPLVDQFTMTEQQWSDAHEALLEATADYEALPKNKSGTVNRRTKAAREKVEIYEQARAAFAARDTAREAAVQQAAHLEGQMHMLEGAMADWRSADWGKILENHQDVARAMHRAMSAGWEGFGFARQAPKDVIEALADINRSYDPITGEGLQNYLQHYDNFLHWTKGWLTTSPGFIMRNIFGGMFNNWLAGANIAKSGKEWGRILWDSAPIRQAGAQADNLAAGDRVLYQVADRLGIIGSGQYSAELGAELGHVAYFNPMAGSLGGEKSFVAPYAAKRANEQFVEPYLRGTLYHDRIVRAIEHGRFEALGLKPGGLANVTEADVERLVKGITDSPVADEILGDIDKYHFNYDDLSRTERQGVKRVIPFYTWTRKNVPLQVEAMFTQPGKAINRYFALKRNIELGSPEQQIVPSWMQQQGFIRTPWHSGENQLYGTVDLPFKDPFKILDVTGQLEGMVNPLIKTPMELRNKRKFFNDVPLTGEYKPMPGSWAKFPGLVQALQLADHMPFLPLHAPAKDAEGNWMLRDSDTYAIDQFLPWMYQAQRMLPFWDAKDKGKPSKESARYTSSLVSYLAGVAMRTNTPQDMESEIYRRIDAVDPGLTDMKSLGQIPERPQRPTRRASLDAVLATVGPRAEERASQQE